MASVELLPIGLSGTQTTSSQKFCVSIPALHLSPRFSNFLVFCSCALWQEIMLFQKLSAKSFDDNDILVIIITFPYNPFNKGSSPIIFKETTARARYFIHNGSSIFWWCPRRWIITFIFLFFWNVRHKPH